MSWLLPAVIANLSSSCLLSLLYWYLYRQDRRRYLAIWAGSWAAYALRFVLLLLSVTTSSIPGLFLSYQLASLASGALLLYGSYVFIGRPFPRAWTLSFLLGAAWLPAAVSLELPFLVVTLPIFTFVGSVDIWTGTLFLRLRDHAGLGRKVLGWSFVLWGLHKLDYPFLRSQEWFAPWGYLLGSLLGLAAAFGVLLLYFEKTRRELEVSEERFRLLAENAKDIIFRLRIKPAPSFDYLSPSVLSFTGYRPEEYYADPAQLFRTIHPEDRPRLRELLHDHGHHPNLLRFLDREGRTVWTELQTTPVMSTKGELLAIEGIVRDVTARKKDEAEKKMLQDQLLQSQKVEAIGQLAGGVAHDFNNLLLAIIGYGQVIMRQLDPTSPLRHDVKEILKAGDRASALTRQLLAFSRRQPLEPRVLDLNAIVGDTGTMLRRLIGEDIRFRTELAPDLHPASADPGQIGQVVMNLAVNARDAMPQGGELTIKTGNVSIDQEFCRLHPAARPGTFVCLSVEDTGTGMSREVVRKIFEPFFSTKGLKGTGLGLSVAHGIIEQHEGWITVYSEPGQGSTFRIYLPALPGIEPDPERRPPAPLPACQGRGERILIAEDEEKVRQLVARVLGANGYRIETAGSAAEALAVFAREGGNFDLLFTDVVLPDQSGLQLIDQLLARKPGLKVMVTSGYSDHKSQWPIIREKGFRFLEKPYALTALLQEVHESLIFEV